jgi:heme-degrading monooxygenase HmoA
MLLDHGLRMRAFPFVCVFQAHLWTAKHGRWMIPHAPASERLLGNRRGARLDEVALYRRLVTQPCNGFGSPVEFTLAARRCAARGDEKMFSVIYEVCPQIGQWDAYLARAKVLRPELEQVPGFTDNILYRGLSREGWILSLTGLRDEQSIVRWLTLMGHHEAQDKDRGETLADYQLRVGEVMFDTHLLDGSQIAEPRLEETGAAKGSAITLIDALQWPDWVNSHNAEEIALYLGFDLNSYGDCISWDVFDAIRSPGSIILLASWKDAASALSFAQSAIVPDDARVRAVRGVRDFDGREASQDHRATEAARQSSVGKNEDVCNDR